jgi:hypothetical protein
MNKFKEAYQTKIDISGKYLFIPPNATSFPIWRIAKQNRLLTKRAHAYIWTVLTELTAG